MTQETVVQYDMGVCVDCGNAWSMSEAEKAWWDWRVKNDFMQYPKRCQSCLAHRRAIKEQQTICSTRLQEIIDEFSISEPDEVKHNLELLLENVKLIEKRIGELLKKSTKTPAVSQL